MSSSTAAVSAAIEAPILAPSKISTQSRPSSRTCSETPPVTTTSGVNNGFECTDNEQETQGATKQIDVDADNDDGADCIDNVDDDEFDCRSDGTVSDIDPVDFSTSGCDISGARSDDEHRTPVNSSNSTEVRRHEIGQEAFHQHQVPAAHHTVSQYHSIQQLSSPASAAAAAFAGHPNNNHGDGVFGNTGLSTRGPAAPPQLMAYDLAAAELFRKAAVDSLQVLRGMMQHHAAAVGLANAGVTGREATGDGFSRKYSGEEYGGRPTSPDDIDEEWNGSGTSGNALSGDEMESDVEGGRIDGSCSNRGSASPASSSGAAPDFDDESLADNEEEHFGEKFNSTDNVQMKTESRTTSDTGIRGRRAWNNGESGHGQTDSSGPDPVEAKRARMENIVISMRRSSSPVAIAATDSDSTRTAAAIKSTAEADDQHDLERDRWMSTKNAIEAYFSTAARGEGQQQQQQQKSNHEDQKVRSKRKQYIPKQHDVSSVQCDAADDCDDEGQQRMTTTKEEVVGGDRAGRKAVSEERGALLAELHRMHDQLAEIKHKYVTLYGDEDGNVHSDEDDNHSSNRKCDSLNRRFGNIVADSWFRAQIINNPGFYGLYNGKNINNNNEVNEVLGGTGDVERASTDFRRKFIDRMSDTATVGRVTGSQASPLGGDTPLSMDVDRIAGMLKAELACGVGSLVDEIVRNFVEKYRLSNGGGSSSTPTKSSSVGRKRDDDNASSERIPSKKVESGNGTDRKDSGSSRLERGEKMGPSTTVENLSKDTHSQHQHSVQRGNGQPSIASTPYPGQQQFPLYRSTPGAAINLPFLPMQTSLLSPAIRSAGSLLHESPADLLFAGGLKRNVDDVKSLEAHSNTKVPSSSFFDRLHQPHQSADASDSHIKQNAQHLRKMPTFDMSPSGSVAAAAAAAAFAHQAGLYHQAASMFGPPTAGGMSSASSMSAPHAAYYPPRVPSTVFPNSAAAVAAATLHQAAAMFSSSSAAAVSSASSSTPCREPEQTEALPLVVNSNSTSSQQSSSAIQMHQPHASNSDVTPIVPKKKRTKVTDTRLSPRAARSILQQSSDSSSHHRHLHHHRGPSDGHGGYHHHHHQTAGRHHHSGHGSGFSDRGTRRLDDDSFDRHRNRSSPVSSGVSHPAGSVDGGRHFSTGVSPTSVGRHQFTGSSAMSVPPQQPDSPSSTSSTSALLPVSLPTSVAVPNPSLQHSDIMQSLFQFGQHHRGGSSTQLSAAFGSVSEDAPPLSSLLQRQACSTPSRYSVQGGPFDFKSQLSVNDGAGSDDAACMSASGSSGSMGDGGYQHGVSGRPGSLPLRSKALNSDNGYDQLVYNEEGLTSTLTPMHLRKAKLMFFYVRYPSSAILKVYFPDVRFNKNNTAQLIKWFSNFREFYYIQMEKYARQALAEGVKVSSDLIVTIDSELYRVLVLHYNRNNQLEVPDSFRTTVQATLREFFKSIQAEKDQEQSWKKAIYKIIARLDDIVPEYFKSPNWMDQLVESTVTSGALAVGSGSGSGNLQVVAGDVKPYSMGHHMA